MKVDLVLDFSGDLAYLAPFSADALSHLAAALRVAMCRGELGPAQRPAETLAIQLETHAATLRKESK